VQVAVGCAPLHATSPAPHTHAQTALRVCTRVSRSLVRTIACYNIDEEDKEATLLGDAEEYLKHQPPAVEVSCVGKEHVLELEALAVGCVCVCERGVSE